MRFVAIDVETACSSIDSICQVGICIFQDGREIGSYESLIDPECRFDRINIGIHGITQRDVANAPPLAAVTGNINAYLRGGIVLSHGPFDRLALGAAYARIGKAVPDCIWLDTIALAKWAWPDQAAIGGYGLAVLARRLDIAFSHHDALEDARAAGSIAIAALARLNVTLDDAVRHLGRPASGTPLPRTPVARRPRTDYPRSISLTEFAGGHGPLSGHRIAFTGTLSIPREDAARRACSFGAECSGSISRRTTLLVIGDNGNRRSGKQVKAETLISEGAAIRIISEAAFFALCRPGDDPS